MIATLMQSRELTRFSVEEYLKLAELGVFGTRRVELIEGLVHERMGPNPPHAVAIMMGLILFPRIVPAGCVFGSQTTIVLRDSAPEPDFFIARGNLRGFADGLPPARCLELVVEAADSTLADDRTIKGRIYARARLPVYWIVNLVDEEIEVYTSPVGGQNPRYRRVARYRRGDTIPLVIGDATFDIAVNDLLPPEAVGE